MAYKEYVRRDQIVTSMGFKDYADYLKSDLWKRTRRRVFARSKGKCFICKSKATEVHHRFYSKRSLGGFSIRKLSAICRECHQAIEFENGRKVWPRRARELAKQRGKALRGGDRLDSDVRIPR